LDVKHGGWGGRGCGGESHTYGLTSLLKIRNPQALFGRAHFGLFRNQLPGSMDRAVVERDRALVARGLQESQLIFQITSFKLKSSLPQGTGSLARRMKKLLLVKLKHEKGVYRR